MNLKAIALGAANGLIAAVMVDLEAWKQAPNDEKFDWGIALKRWAIGAITGALAGMGLGTL